MYVRLLPDLSHPQRMTRWAEVSDGTPVPGSPFVRGEVYDGPEPIHLPLIASGPTVDFSFGFQDMPIVRKPLADAILRVSTNDIQVVNAVIGDDDADFVVLNAITLVDAIDEERSMTVPLLEEQRMRGWKGKYGSVANIHLHYEKIGDAQFFRLTYWPMALMASDPVVDVLRQFKATGVRWECA
jgi:hypothetical protein